MDYTSFFVKILNMKSKDDTIQMFVNNIKTIIQGGTFDGK